MTWIIVLIVAFFLYSTLDLFFNYRLKMAAIKEAKDLDK